MPLLSFRHVPRARRDLFRNARPSRRPVAEAVSRSLPGSGAVYYSSSQLTSLSSTTRWDTAAGGFPKDANHEGIGNAILRCHLFVNPKSSENNLICNDMNGIAADVPNSLLATLYKEIDSICT